MPDASNYNPVLAYEDLTVATDATASAAFDLHGGTLCGLFVPSNFDGTTITITASTSLAGTFVSVQNGHETADAYTITTTASRYVPLDNLAIPAGLRFIKLVTGSTQTTTDTVFSLAIRPV